MLSFPGNTEVADKGPIVEWFGLAHTPVPMPKALSIPSAWEASQGE